MNKSADLVVTISLFIGWLGIVLGGLSVLAGMVSGDPITGFAGGGFVGLGISVLLAAYAVQSVFHIAKKTLMNKSK